MRNKKGKRKLAPGNRRSRAPRHRKPSALSQSTAPEDVLQSAIEIVKSLLEQRRASGSALPVDDFEDALSEAVLSYLRKFFHHDHSPTRDRSGTTAPTRGELLRPAVAFLMTATTTRMIDMYRARHRARTRSIEHREALPDHARASPESVVLNHERAHEAMRVVRLLGLSTRDATVLGYFLENRSHRECAAKLGTTATNARKLLSRTLAKIRTEYARRFPEEP